MPKETIEHAALLIPGGQHPPFYVPRPGRHHDVIRSMAKEFSVEQIASAIQGFITSKSRFVTRTEALVIAEVAGQIKQKTFPLGQLFSEDVW